MSAACSAGYVNSPPEMNSALGRLVLELGHAGQLAVAHRALHHPRQLAVLDDVALHEHGGDVGVEPDGEQHRRQLRRALADHARLLGDGEGVEVDDPVERVGLVLAGDPVPQRAQVVAQMDVAGRLDAREHAGHGSEGTGRPARRREPSPAARLGHHGPMAAEPDARTERGFDRFVNFSDAVVAIAISLLILPVVDAVNDAAQAATTSAYDFFQENGDRLLAFGLSFVVIASFWVDPPQPCSRRSRRTRRR